uniref:(northern house mosquito) hypothetical protein n=1 Tax=Culex pipiens TaxID=7175 RepID=A0A8D8N712_CULPI
MDSLQSQWWFSTLALVTSFTDSAVDLYSGFVSCSRTIRIGDGFVFKLSVKHDSSENSPLVSLRDAVIARWLATLPLSCKSPDPTVATVDRIRSTDVTEPAVSVRLTSAVATVAVAPTAMFTL